MAKEGPGEAGVDGPTLAAAIIDATLPVLGSLASGQRMALRALSAVRREYVEQLDIARLFIRERTVLQARRVPFTSGPT